MMPVCSLLAAVKTQQWVSHMLAALDRWNKPQPLANLSNIQQSLTIVNSDKNKDSFPLPKVSASPNQTQSCLEDPQLRITGTVCEQELD